MIFWKIFAWIATGWAVLFRRGEGVSFGKKGSSERNQDVGPTWRRVSSGGPYPGRRAKGEATDFDSTDASSAEPDNRPDAQRPDP